MTRKPLRVGALVALLAPSVALAAEPELCETDNAAIRTHYEAAEQAWSDGRLDDFEASRLAAHQALACLHQLVEPARAAELYTLEAVAASRQRGARPVEARQQAEAAFLAALQALPGYTPSEVFAFPGGELDIWYDQAVEAYTYPNRRPPPTERPTYHCPEGARLRLDGQAELAARCGEGWPQGRPVIVQVVEDNGAVRWSGLVPADTPRLPIEVFEPTAPRWPPAQPATDEAWEALIRDRFPDPARPWWWTSGATLATAGGLYSAALLSSLQWEREVEGCAIDGACWDDPTAAYERTERMRQRTNALTLGAAGAAGIGVGVGLVALRIELRPRCR